MWEARTKNDLMIEVWEKLDCENVGESEIVAIETVVKEVYGANAVESPMIIARLLADEGAELRHSEIMSLNVKRFLESPYAPMFRNIFNISSFSQALASIRRIENLRRKFSRESDKEGLRLTKESTIRAKSQALEIAQNPKLSDRQRLENAEIAEWLTIWLQSPEVFENWIKLRQRSQDFQTKFDNSEPRKAIEKDVF